MHLIAASPATSPPPRTPSDPLDILYVGTLPPHPGGSAVLAGQLLAGFAAAGHRVRAIAPGVADMEPMLTPVGVEVHWFQVPMFETSPDQPALPGYREGQELAIASLMHTLLGAVPVSVVIIGRENFCEHVTVAAHAAGLPTVLWVQGASVWGVRHGSLPEATTRRLIDAMGRADRVVAVAAHLVETLAELGIGGAEAIPNGVDLARFSPAVRGAAQRELLAIPPDHLLVLHASNMKQLKRPGDCVRAAAITAEARRDVSWVLLGDGPMLAEVRAEAIDAGLDHCMHFPGWVAHADMAAWLAAADVVVMPSAAEALALVYLETMATGRVLVASDIPGASEVIADGENGLLFPVCNVERIAEHVLRLAAHPALRQRIGASARQAAERHGMQACIEAHLRVLAAAVGR
jgi:glycosyltransferase involved in cell wall biosynthesis